MDNNNIIEIGKDQLPTKTFSLAFKVPTYGDYREARKKYPYPTNNNSTGPGYSVEELLFASLITSIDGRALVQSPKDVMDRLSPMAITDRQFLLTAFMEAFFLEPTVAKDARKLAQDYLSTPPEINYTIGKDRIPSGTKSVTINRPNTGTQMSVDRRFQSAEVNGCSFEEMLLATCIAQINGKQVEVQKDPIALLDDWTIADVHYCNLVFINTFTLDDSGTEAARDLGKLIKAGGLFNKQSSKAKDTTTPV